MMKNKLLPITLGMIAIGVTLTSPIFAVDPFGPKSPQPTSPAEAQILANLGNLGAQLSSIPAAIASQSANLQAEIQNIAISTIDYISHQNYQIDTNLPVDASINTATTQINGKNTPYWQAAPAIANQATENNLDNSLKWFVHSLYPDDKSITAANGESFKHYANQNSLARLTIYTPADDSLYITKPSQIETDTYLNYKDILEKPTVKNNRFFDFANLITPTAYSPSQQTAAEAFVKYAAQSTQNMAQSIDFSSLASSAEKLNVVLNSAPYQSYMMNIRNLLALRSMAVQALNQLIAERTPIAGLGKMAGLASDAASPLQVEAYMANHRIQDPNWYESVQKASPATLQRKTLVILAEIEHQNYEAQLQREQLLAQLAAMNIQIGTTSKMLLKEKVQQLNQLINPSSTGVPAGTPQQIP